MNDLDKATELARGVHAGSQLRGGQYKLSSLLGWSDLSSVWSAQSATGTHAAIKVAKPGSMDAQQCVHQELIALSSINQQQPQWSSVTESSASSTPSEQHAGKHHAEKGKTGSIHVVQLLDTFYHTTRTGHRTACLVLEQLGNSLQQLLHNRTSPSSHTTNAHVPISSMQPSALTPLPPDAVKHLAHDLLLGLHHVHCNGWVHRDIKPGNIMTSRRVLIKQPRTRPNQAPTDQGPSAADVPPHQDTGKPDIRILLHEGRLKQATWKLIDFGNAVHVGSRLRSKKQHALSHDSPKHHLQTCAYTSPEILLGVVPQEYVTLTNGVMDNEGQGGQSGATHPALWIHPANDLWSVGCVLYEAATGYKLFDVPRCRRLLTATTLTNRAPGAVPALASKPPSPWPQWRGWPWTPSTPMPAETHIQHDSSSECMPINAMEEEELQLWHMVHVLGPIDTQVVRRSTSSSSVSMIDSEGGSRLDYHPVAAAVIKRLSQLDGKDNVYGPTINTDNAGDASALLPLDKRLMWECGNMSELERRELSSFLRDLLVYEPKARPSAADALKHPWLSDIKQGPGTS